MKIQNLKKRKENIKRVFPCPLPEKGKRGKILLIDDVCTTRATLEEVAKVLKQAGAKQVWEAVIALSAKTIINFRKANLFNCLHFNIKF